MSTATQAMPARRAMRARVPREVPSVRAMNDGTTASGLTMVMTAMNDSSATRYSGMVELAGAILHVDQPVLIDVPDPPAARPPGDAAERGAVLLDLRAVALEARLVDLAALVVDDEVAAVDADEAVDSSLDDVAARVEKGNGQLAADDLGLRDALVGCRVAQRGDAALYERAGFIVAAMLLGQQRKEGVGRRGAVPALEEAVEQRAGGAGGEGGAGRKRTG